MSKSRHALRAIAAFLSEQLSRGWACLQVVRRVDGARALPVPGHERAFWGTIYDACVESAILALARLVVTHKDSISVTYLLNCVEQSPSAFPVQARPAIREMVEGHRALLGEMEPLVERVKDYRDRTIAHLDKKYVNHRDMVQAQPPVGLDEVERAFVRIGALLNVYCAGLDLPALDLPVVELAPPGEGNDPRLAQMLADGEVQQ